MKVDHPPVNRQEKYRGPEELGFHLERLFGVMEYWSTGALGKIIGVQNNVTAQKTYQALMNAMSVNKQEYWNTGMLEIIFLPIIPLFHHSIIPGSFMGERG